MTRQAYVNTKNIVPSNWSYLPYLNDPFNPTKKEYERPSEFPRPFGEPAKAPGTAPLEVPMPYAHPLECPRPFEIELPRTMPHAPSQPSYYVTL